MNSIKKYISGLGRTARTVILGLAVVFVSAGVAQATSNTIDTSVTTTNVTASGTLGVTGQTTLVQSTSTMLSAYSAYFGGSATSTFSSAGALTLIAALSGTSGTFSTTLGVTGVSTFTNSSTTQSATIGGPLWVGGNATTTAAGALSLQSNLSVIGNSTLTGTLGV